jgi:hypothetical protein
MLTATDHPCHFYRSDVTLATTVASFLAPALAERSALIAIGTRAHIAAIEQRLRTDGYDLDEARASRRYVAIDAERIVGHLLRDGMPTSETFDAVIGARLARLASEHGRVRAFGEIVSLLSRDGKHLAALRLEELWHDAMVHQPLALICGYSARAVRDATGGVEDRIIAAHTRVIDDARSA